jgi:hypothetical protein
LKDGQKTVIVLPERQFICYLLIASAVGFDFLVSRSNPPCQISKTLFDAAPDQRDQWMNSHLRERGAFEQL